MGAQTLPGPDLGMCWLTADTFFCGERGLQGRPGRPRAALPQSRRGARLGPAVLAEVGGRALERHLAGQAGRPDLGEAHDAARHGGQLGVLDGARVVACARARARWVVRAHNHNATMLKCYNALPMLGGCLKCSSLHLGEPVPDSIKAVH